MNKFLTLIICFSLAACGGGGDEPVNPSPPVSEQPPLPPVAPTPEVPQPTEPIEIPPPPPPVEPVIIPEPMPVESIPPVGTNPNPPLAETPMQPSDPYSHPVAPNRTTIPPNPPYGMYSIYRTELTNSLTPWNEFIGSFHTLDEAEARFKKEGEPIMYGEGYQYIIMNGSSEIYPFSWPCVCIPR